MSFAIIFNKDTLFALSTAQRAFLKAINTPKTLFMPSFPLWCEDSSGFIASLYENPDKMQSLQIQRGEIKNNALIFPVEIKSADEVHIFEIVAGKRITPSALDIDTACISSIDFEPMNVRVMRIAETADLGENCFGTQKSKWVKLKR